MIHVIINMRYIKVIFLLLILTWGGLNARGQRAEIGLNAGGAGYIGDLNQFNPVKISGISTGIFAKINFDPYWGVGLHYNYGRIKADDRTSRNAVFRDRNLNFHTTLHEIAFIGSFNFIDMYSPGSKKRLSPYLFLGIGGVIFNPKGEFNDSEFELRDYLTEGQTSLYRKYAVAIPYGAGVKYKKSENWTIFGQIGYRTVFTDYLDDVSGVYPLTDAVHKSWLDRNGNPLNLTDRSEELYGAPGKFNPGDQRGDFRKRDTYLFVNIGISYTFVGQKCFTF